MDIWASIALIIVVPAVIFLVTAASISALGMPRGELRVLLLAGLLLAPVAVVCVWLSRQPWLAPPWDWAVDWAGNVTGLVVSYAIIAATTVSAKRGLGLIHYRR